METRANYILIGSFVMVAIGAAFLFVLHVTSTQGDFDEYEIIFDERVTGLSNGSIVRFNGIQVGEVESLTLDPDNPARVISRVRVAEGTPVKTDTTVELEPVGFTGLAIIQFVGGTPSAPLLKEVSEDRTPKIFADSSGINMLLQSSGDLFARANLLLSDENINNIAKTLSDVQTVTGAIAENRDEISDLIKNANQATEDLSATIEKLRRASEGLETMLAEEGPDAIRNADALISDSRALVTELETLVAENREAVQYFADQGLGQVAPALAEARTLMRSLDRLVREMERDPKAFFLGEGTPVYEGEGE